MRNITYYRFLRYGSAETKDMAESHRDYHVEAAQRTYPKSHVMNGVTVHRVDTTTRDGATLRVDWLADDAGSAYVWFAEEGETPHKGPESYGTIWVCTCCMLHHANGECGDCHREEGHEKEPLSAIEAPFTVAMGMAYSEHSEDCPNYFPEGADTTQAPGNVECDCEAITFSMSMCEGCGTHLYGERHAMTLFKD